MISFISSFKITKVVIPNPKIFFWISTAIADADAVNPDGIKTIFANGLSTFFIFYFYLFFFFLRKSW